MNTAPDAASFQVGLFGRPLGETLEAVERELRALARSSDPDNTSWAKLRAAVLIAASSGEPCSRDRTFSVL